MKREDEYIRSLPAPSDLHEAAVTQAISALMSEIAATDQSYVHRTEICRRLQHVVCNVSRGSQIVCRQLLLSLLSFYWFIVVVGDGLAVSL